MLEQRGLDYVSGSGGGVESKGFGCKGISEGTFLNTPALTNAITYSLETRIVDRSAGVRGR